MGEDAATGHALFRGRSIVLTHLDLLPVLVLTDMLRNMDLFVALLGFSHWPHLLFDVSNVDFDKSLCRKVKGSPHLRKNRYALLTLLSIPLGKWTMLV